MQLKPENKTNKQQKNLVKKYAQLPESMLNCFLTHFVFSKAHLALGMCD